jgi:ketosteroid isomerase-like protein
MSQENVEIVRGCCEATARGDWDAAMTAIHPEIEYDLSFFPEGRIYHGHAGIREAFRIWLGAWQDYRQEWDEILDAGEETVVVIGRELGRGKSSGVEVKRDVFAVWTLSEGKGIRIQFHPEREAALKAAGLRE